MFATSRAFERVASHFSSSKFSFSIFLKIQIFEFFWIFEKIEKLNFELEKWLATRSKALDVANINTYFYFSIALKLTELWAVKHFLQGE